MKNLVLLSLFAALLVGTGFARQPGAFELNSGPATDSVGVPASGRDASLLSNSEFDDMAD